MRNRATSIVPPLVAFALLVAVVVGIAWRMPPPVFAQFGQPAGQYQALVTVSSAGTPVQVSTLHVVVASLMAQPVVGSSVGLVYICTGIRSGTTPTADCAATANGSYELGAQLAAATSTTPGPTYSFYVPAPGIDLSTIWVDAQTSGTEVLFSWFAHQ
jgi:hypothetical protein